MLVLVELAVLSHDDQGEIMSGADGAVMLLLSIHALYVCQQQWMMECKHDDCNVCCRCYMPAISDAWLDLRVCYSIVGFQIISDWGENMVSAKPLFDKLACFFFAHLRAGIFACTYHGHLLT